MALDTQTAAWALTIAAAAAGPPDRKAIRRCGAGRDAGNDGDRGGRTANILVRRRLGLALYRDGHDG